MLRNQDGSKLRRPSKRKRTLNIATWNVQGLNTKTDEVFQQLDKYKIDICVIPETKRKGKGNEIRGNYVFFYSGVNKDKRAKAGIGIAIHKKLKRSIQNWQEISERILKMEIEIYRHSIILLAIYAPNDDANNETKNEFEKQLTDLLDNIGNRKEILMVGDMNSRVGKKWNNPVEGPFGEDTTNDNGRRLLELCETYSLKIMNGFFPHKDIHKYTWLQPTRNLKSIIDYVIQKQKSEIKIKDVRVFRGAECGTDHMLLKAEMQLSYRNLRGKEGEENNKNKNNTHKNTIQKYNLDKLQDNSIRFLYQLRLAQKLSDNPTGGPEEKYETMKNKIHDAAFEALGYQDTNTKTKLPWVDKDTEELIAEKKILYERWLATQDDEDRKQYVRTSREVKKAVRKRKNLWWEQQCDDIERNIGGTRTSESWKFLKKLRTNDNSRTNVQIIKLDEWMEYYSKMLKEERPEYKENIFVSDTEQRDNRNIQEITIDEIKKTLQNMKNGKSPGPGGIPIELVKNAPIVVLEILKEIFNQCLIQRHPIPKEWNQAYLSSIYKKGSKSECKNYRGISVTASIGRLYGRIIKARIEETIAINEEQSGFTGGRSCVDNIFTIKQILEKRIARNLETHLVFIDLEKAYDTVPLKRLFEKLNNTNINQIYIAAIKDLYKEQESYVKVGTNLSTQFTPTKGLKQGCCLSPTLFKIYLNEILKEWQDKCRGMGLNINGGYLHTLLFADDQVLLAADEFDTDYMLRKLEETYEKNGLKINFDKTKCIVVGGIGNDLTINGNVVKAEEQYKYLGTLITNEGNSKREIESRITQGKKAIRQLNSILWSDQITKYTKKRIYETIVQSILLYGSETWELRERDKERMKAVQMDFMRRSCRVSRLQHIRNERILEEMNVEKTVVEEIETRRLKWYGHMRRMGDERWPRRAWEWQPQERRKKGRPRAEWNTQIRKDMEMRQLEDDQWEDKNLWRLGCERRLGRL